MKIFSVLLLFLTFSASASPLMTVKDRLRLHLWTFGLEEKPVKQELPKKVLPEELERALKKI
jgi:hypothetical protein